MIILLKIQESVDGLKMIPIRIKILILKLSFKDHLLNYNLKSIQIDQHLMKWVILKINLH